MCMWVWVPGVAARKMTRCSNRSVSFVERVELEFQGNHFCQALSLGDVDGDGVSIIAVVCG